MEIAFGDFHDSFSPGEAISRDPRSGGVGKSPDIRRGKNNRTSHRLPLSLRGADRRRGNPYSFRPPEGDGRCFAPQGTRIARPCGPRNDVVNLAGPSDLGGWLLVCGRAILESPLHWVFHTVGQKEKRRAEARLFWVGMGLLGDLADDLVHLVPLLLHVGDQLELGPAAVQVLLRVADVEVVVAV